MKFLFVWPRTARRKPNELWVLPWKSAGSGMKPAPAKAT
jgi:hypothetical protein